MRKRAERTSEARERGTLAVIGAGAWGTTLAGILACRFRRVNLYTPEADVAEEVLRFSGNERYVGEYRLPRNVLATCSMSEAVGRADIVLVAVPSSASRDVARELEAVSGGRAPVVLATKGLEAGSGLLSLEVWRQECRVSPRRCARDALVFSGPNLASELRAGHPSVSVVAGTDPGAVKAACGLLACPMIATVPYHDPLGVQVAGALKNVYAVACGIARGLGWGDNLSAAIMWRGLEEVSEFAAAVGGDPGVVMTPAGIGDFVATCSSPLSRNHDLGLRLAGLSGASGVGGVREGAQTAREAARRARSMSLELPMLETIWSVMEGAERPAAIIEAAVRADRRADAGAPVRVERRLEPAYDNL